MDNITKENISLEQAAYLKNHNLRAMIEKSVDADNPRHVARATWFGCDHLIYEPDNQPVLLAEDGSELKTIDAMATRILADSGLDINNFYYRGVVDTGIRQYFLVFGSTHLTDKTNGFIIISKDQMQKAHGETARKLNLSEKETDILFSVKAEELFLWEIDTYSKWLNGEVYDITVCTNDHSNVDSSKTVKEVYGIKDLIRAEVSDAASEVIDDINAFKGALKLTLKMDTQKVDSDFIGFIAKGIIQEFDFALTIGSTTEDYNTGVVTLVIIPDEIPAFQELINSSGFHLIQAMEKHTLGENGNDSLSTWKTVNMLMNPLPFSEWSSIMQKALLNTIFEAIHHTKLIDIEQCINH